MASTSNNYMLIFDEEKTVTGRIYYKVRKSGRYAYRFLFSDIVDSTFADGSVSRANLCGEGYEIVSAYAGCLEAVDNTVSAEECFESVLFGGNTEKTVSPGEAYWSDEVSLDIKEGAYLVFEWTVRGKRMAYTPDKIVPSFVKKENGEFMASCEFPQPNLVGCDAESEKNLVFLGDSITMGLGTSVDGYNFWAARIARGLGEKYAVWNIGLGYGRCQDAASDGVWLEKAKQYDIAAVCMGVNDILQGRSAEQLKADLTTVVDRLKEAGVKICLFTVPSFNWAEDKKPVWDEVNGYIEKVLGERVDYLFDMATASSSPDDRYMARDKNNAHPTDEVCAYIAERFLEKYSSL